MKNKSDRYISGPVNIMRLSGKINNINKVIYLFSDYHANANDQTECENINEIHLKQLFASEFKKISENKSKRLDFFCEYDNLHYISIGDKVSSYLHNVYKYIYKQNSEKMYNNIYIHQMDKRIYTSGAGINDVSADELYKIFQKNIQFGNFVKNELDDIKLHCTNIKKHITYYIDTINDLFKQDNTYILKKPYDIYSFKTIDELNNIPINDRHEYIKYFLYRLMWGTNNLVVRTYINNVIKNIFIPQFTLIIQLVDYIYNVIITYNINLSIFENKKNISSKYGYFGQSTNIENISNLLLKSIRISTIFLNTFSVLMDLHIIKKLLDKDYITHCIAYVGVYHSIDVCRMLVQNFNFKITNISKLPSNVKLDAFSEIILKSELYDISYIIKKYICNKKNEKLIQCSNMINFPDNFN